jgi:hypothetical protein
MTHCLSDEDRAFQKAFEAHTVLPAGFDHRAHVWLAYIYLVENDADAAHRKMRRALLDFLQFLGVGKSKYHETMTRAWILAVQHFMGLRSGFQSAAAFIDANPRVLDTSIMMTHYSAQLLFSDEARAAFVEPNLEPIPNKPLTREEMS